ncbi:UNVERIFIED_CONTAM: hypothetical protein Scaly_0902800 [Sesamum calycinum]|uniref:Nuclear transcription factor Y subunit n=1 Tax=Sesamum calycinum TaxID=2727403 RepID=A0AAW2QWS7_9LAMI
MQSLSHKDTDQTTADSLATSFGGEHHYHVKLSEPRYQEQDSSSLSSEQSHHEAANSAKSDSHMQNISFQPGSLKLIRRGDDCGGAIWRRPTKLEAQKAGQIKKAIPTRVSHLHALRRARGSGGRFLNTKKMEQQNPPNQTYDKNLSSKQKSGHASEPEIQHSESNSWETPLHLALMSLASSAMMMVFSNPS